MTHYILKRFSINTKNYEIWVIPDGLKITELRADGSVKSEIRLPLESAVDLRDRLACLFFEDYYVCEMGILHREFMKVNSSLELRLELTVVDHHQLLTITQTKARLTRSPCPSIAVQNSKTLYLELDAVLKNTFHSDMDYLPTHTHHQMKEIDIPPWFGSQYRGILSFYPHAENVLEDKEEFSHNNLLDDLLETIGIDEDVVRVWIFANNLGYFATDRKELDDCVFYNAIVMIQTTWSFWSFEKIMTGVIVRKYPNESDALRMERAIRQKIRMLMNAKARGTIHDVIKCIHDEQLLIKRFSLTSSNSQHFAQAIFNKVKEPEAEEAYLLTPGETQSPPFWM